MLRVSGLAFGPPKGSTAPAEASYVPMFLHLTIVAITGIYLPGPVVTWFQNVARLLG
jgi:hydrogenase-4 component F